MSTDPGFEQRQEAQLHRRRIAAGIADDARAADRLAIHLRQAVDRFGEQVGARVRHPVPLLEHGRVLEAEIGGEIDDLHAGARELARLGHRDAVRRGEEHDVAGGEIGARGVGEREIVPAAQAGKHVGDRVPASLREVIVRTSASGCCASRRSSSTPV